MADNANTGPTVVKGVLSFQDIGTAVVKPESGMLGLAVAGGAYKFVAPDGTQIPIGTGGGVAATKPALVLGRSAGTILYGGDSVISGNPGAKYKLLSGFESSLKKRLRGAGVYGFTMPTFTNTAVSGQSCKDIFVTNVTAQLITPAADGNDIIVNGGINDILGAGGGAPASLSDTLGWVASGLNAIFAARPNSRLYFISALWGNGEAWTLDANGIPTGNNTYDPQIRTMNAALAALIGNYPNARFIDLYTPFYQASAARNPAKTATGVFTQDGLHPGVMGCRIAGELFLNQVETFEAQTPVTVSPASRADYSRGDWYEESWNYITSMNSNGGPESPPLTFNRWDKLVFSNPGGNVYQAGAVDGNVEGGGVKFNPVNVLQLGPTVFQAPKTVAWVLAFRAKFPAIGASMKCLFGLGDSLVTTVPAGDGIFVGIDQAFNGTQFVLESIHLGTATKNAGGTPFTADTAFHDFFLMYDPAAASGVGIYDLMIDRRQVAHLNPDANFPQTPVALAAALCASSGTVTVSRAMYMWIE